jgi:hypothetical protein
MGAAADLMHADVDQADTGGRIAGSSGEVDARGVEVTTPLDPNLADRVSGSVEYDPTSLQSTVSGADPADQPTTIAESVIQGPDPADYPGSGLRSVTGEDGRQPPPSDLRGLMGDDPEGIARSHGH